MVQALTPAHQLFLQRMMAAKVMTDDDAKKLHKEIVLLYDDSNDHSQDFERFVGRVSSNLREHLDFDIRNRVSDAPAQLFGAFNKNPHEIALFKIVLEKLIQKGNGDEENDDCSENEDNNAPRRVLKKESQDARATSHLWRCWRYGASSQNPHTKESSHCSKPRMHWKGLVFSSKAEQQKTMIVVHPLAAAPALGNDDELLLPPMTKT